MLVNIVVINFLFPAFCVAKSQSSGSTSHSSPRPTVPKSGLFERPVWTSSSNKDIATFDMDYNLKIPFPSKFIKLSLPGISLPGSRMISAALTRAHSIWAFGDIEGRPSDH